VQVRGIYRDFARPLGTVLVDLQDYRQRSGDTRINELALWLTPGAAAPELQAVQSSLRALLPEPTLLEFAASKPLRELSLRIFDRSFAVTNYLQAVAIVIGLVGVAASLSAQVLARRKEFGLLAHLGFTQRQVLTLVAAETAAWMSAGTAVGVALGLAVSLVLVWVVNPQSFHWTMQWAVPVWRVAALALAVWCAGVGTTAFTARRALSRSAVLSVKEDW
jgi:putative ABC transport system permease protein